MVLTFRSTGTTEIYIVEKDSDGAKRIARAVQDETNPRAWNAQLEHPSGVRPCSRVYGSRGDVALALTHYLNETQIEWMHEKARGGKSEDRGLRDRSVSVNDLGQTIGAPPIGGTIRR